MCGELGGGVGEELFGSLVLLALPACNVRDCFPLLSSCSSQTSIHHRPETCEKFEAFRLGRSSGIHFVQRSVVSPFVGCCIVRCVRSLDFVPPRAALFFLPPGPAVLRHGADDTLPPQIAAELPVLLACGAHRTPSGQLSARRRTDFGFCRSRVRPKPGPEFQFPARKN